MTARQLGGSTPPPGWWQQFVTEEKNAAQPGDFPKAHSPRVGLQLFAIDKGSGVYRAYRSRLGSHRQCYEALLAKAPAASGHWVARVTQGSQDRACTVELVSSTVPRELSDCVKVKLMEQSTVGHEAGQLELVLSFNPQ